MKPIGISCNSCIYYPFLSAAYVFFQSARKFVKSTMKKKVSHLDKLFSVNELFSCQYYRLFAIAYMDFKLSRYPPMYLCPLFPHQQDAFSIDFSGINRVAN